jgi:dihydrofolate reductase
MAAARLSLIVAMAQNRVIGANGTLPWHLPADLQRFKALTMGHHIIMGRKTWESIGRLLPGRTTVVVTRNAGYQVPGAVVAHTLDEAITACDADDEIFVIGGAELFKSAMDRADRLYLTTLHRDFDGDTWMPELDESRWTLTASERFGVGPGGACDYTFAQHDRH